MYINKSNKYKEFFSSKFMMGPNSLRLLDELTDKYSIGDDKRVLDLGCGTGITSMFVAKETNSQVFAVDLWCSASDNYKRFKGWGIDSSVIPIYADASELPFANDYFDVVISVDAYHYFAGEENFFSDKVLPFVKKGGLVLIAVPGLKEEFERDVPKEMTDWLGEEYKKFHSCEWWKNIIGKDDDIEWAVTWEMENFDIAWKEWLALENEYAVQDKQAFCNDVDRYINFVGIAVRKSC